MLIKVLHTARDLEGLTDDGEWAVIFDGQDDLPHGILDDRDVFISLSTVNHHASCRRGGDRDIKISIAIPPEKSNN
jgi:hypothetical protein